ncbi:MAG: Maf family protein [Desulfobacteraceae bacterium]|jgi:septum formation protein
MTFRYISDKNPLILASASPRRKELLEQVKIPFTVLPSQIDENGEKGEPFEICTRLAEKKALSLYNSSNNNWILGADTIVVKDGNIMGKPVNAEEAAYMLNSLSNEGHDVITGFSIVDPSGCVAESNYESTTVNFKSLTGKEIDAYIKTGEPFGKAGAYAIQGIGAFMIKSISGSYSNVVGLPLYSVMDSLNRLKAIEGFPLI